MSATDAEQLVNTGCYCSGLMKGVPLVCFSSLPTGIEPAETCHMLFAILSPNNAPLRGCLSSCLQSLVKLPL